MTASFHVQPFDIEQSAQICIRFFAYSAELTAAGSVVIIIVVE